MKKLFKAALVALMLVPSVGAAQDYDKGLAAFQAGDYATALVEWLPLAEQGNAEAQYKVGLIYNGGLGVPENDVEALKWYSLAAAQGDAWAVAAINRLEGEERRESAEKSRLAIAKLKAETTRKEREKKEETARKELEKKKNVKRATVIACFSLFEKDEVSALTNQICSPIFFELGLPE